MNEIFRFTQNLQLPRQGCLIPPKNVSFQLTSSHLMRPYIMTILKIILKGFVNTDPDFQRLGNSNKVNYPPDSNISPRNKLQRFLINWKGKMCQLLKRISVAIQSSVSQPSLMFVGKARGKPQGSAPEKLFTRVGPRLTRKHQIRLERLARDKHFRFFQRFVNQGPENIYNIGPWWLYDATKKENIIGRRHGHNITALTYVLKIKGQLRTVVINSARRKNNLSF